ncbi:MAG: HYD1 signature containing ADP-ribosyltransferase family protein [Massilia sp.]
MQFRVITGDLDADEFQVAQTYLSGNAREGNRLELDASRGFFNDDEARIEEIMRTLSPTDLEALHNTAGWAETAARVRSALGGTDEDVFDALDAGRPARADALRWRDRMNEARLRGETDSLQDAAAEYSGATSYGGSAVSAADRRRMVQQEFATLLRESGAVERGEVTEAQLATPGEAVAAYATRSTAVLHSSWLSGIRVENEAVTGNDQQLLRDTILGGEDSVAARQSRLAVEFGRDGGPRMLRIDSALVDPRLNPNTYPGGVIPPDILAAARADREAVVSGFRTRFHDTDPNGPSDRDYLGSRIDRAFGSDTYGANIANLLMYEEVPSPATASHMMRYGMTHEMGTNEALLDRVVGRMNRDEIAQMQTHYNQFGSDLRADLGVYGHGTFGELSGDERLSMEVKLLGVPRNDRERAEVATFTAQQQRDETGGVGGWLASHDFQGDALTYEMNRLHQSSGISVRRDAEGMPVFSGGEHNFTDGAYTGRDRAMFESSASGAVDAAHSFSARVDTYANFAANAIMVIGAVVATVLTAGGAGPLLLAAIAAGTGLTAMAARRMISGGRYGWEQALTDLGTTLVQALTAGLGASLGLASRGGSAAVGTGMRAGLTGRIPQELLRANMGRLTGTALGDTLLIGAATNGLNSLGSTAMNEATWERGFGHGMGELLSGTGTGVFTGMLGAGIGHGLGAIRPGAIPGIGRMMSKANQTSTLGDLLGHASPVTRALGQGGIAGISGFGSRYAELAIQAGRGRFHGDAGDMFVESGQAGLQAGFQGMGESFGEQFVQHRMEVAARRAAATDSGADIRALPEPPPVRALPAHVEPEPPALVVPTHAATEPVIVPPARTGAAPESVPEAGSGAVPPRAPHEGDGDGGGGGGRRPPHEDDRLFPNLTDAEIDAAFAGAEARLMVRVGAEQPGADTRALLPAVPGEPTLQQRQRAGALHEQADGLAQRSNAALDQAIETAARARAAAAYNPRRAAALHAAAEAQLQEAINLDNQATARRQEAAEFTSGRRSPLADLPGPDDLLNQIDTLAPEASGLVNVPLSAVETNPALLERMARMLVSGEHGGRMVFRVESERSRSLVSVDAAGNVTVAGGASVHVNFGSFERAVEFVLDSARGNARIFAFEVDEAWVRSARSAAIPEHETAALGGRQPRLVDVRFADDQMEIPPGLIGELNRFIIPGSGMQFEIPASRRPSPPDEGGPPVSLGGGPDQAEAMRQALLRHVPTDQHGAMADVPIEILAPDQYRAMTRSDSGPVVTLIRDGRPVVVVREGTPIGRLADEGPHLSQAHEAPTQARVARLDEAALAHWDELDLDTQLDLYRNKVELEIDAHTRIATSLDNENELGAADPARLAREREGNDMTLRNLRARLDEDAALGPRQRADIASGAMERPQYLDQPARLFSKRSGYEGQPELRAPRSSADPDTPDGRRQIHEDWVEQMRRGFLDPGSMPSMVPDGGAIPNRMLWHDTIDSAYAVYDQVLRASGGSIEVGIARDGRTGRYMVARGGPVSVRYPNESMFLETVLHYHPDYGPALYHGPSGTDLQSAIATAKSSGRPVTEFIEHGDANGRARTAFTVTRIDDANVPGGVRVQVDLEYVRQGTGEYRHQRFNSMREWSDYYHARTTALDPDGPVYRSLLAGAIAARDRRQTVGPRQAVTGDEMPPSPEHAGLQRAVRAAQRSEEAVDARLEVNRNERLALEGERDLLRASADGSPPERLGRVEARLARLQAAADALEVRRAAAADKTTAAQAAVARSTAEREQAAREAAARPPPPPVVLEYPGGTDRQPSVPYTGPETTLYHYTDAAGLAAILLSQELRLSTGPTHARFGDGQYFTDLAPEAIGARTIGDLTAEQRAQGLISASQASQRLFNDTRMVGRLLHYIEIDVSGLPLRQGMLPSGAAPRDNVQFVLGSTNFPLAGRIVRSGRTY